MLKKTTIQDTHQIIWSQYNQLPSVQTHPNVHGTFVAKNFNLTHLNLLHPLGVNVAQWIYVVSYITKLCVIKVNGI